MHFTVLILMPLSDQSLPLSVLVVNAYADNKQHSNAPNDMHHWFKLKANG